MPPTRILIVDDDEYTAFGLAQLREGEGYSVRVVTRFEDGIHIVQTDPPDLLMNLVG